MIVKEKEKFFEEIQSLSNYGSDDPISIGIRVTMAENMIKKYVKDDDLVKEYSLKLKSIFVYKRDLSLLRVRDAREKKIKDIIDLLYHVYELIE